MAGAGGLVSCPLLCAGCRSWRFSSAALGRGAGGLAAVYAEGANRAAVSHQPVLRKFRKPCQVPEPERAVEPGLAGSGQSRRGSAAFVMEP